MSLTNPFAPNSAKHNASDEPSLFTRAAGLFLKTYAIIAATLWIAGLFPVIFSTQQPALSRLLLAVAESGFRGVAVMGILLTFVFPILVTILYCYYSYGLFMLQRWTVAISVLIATSSVLSLVYSWTYTADSLLTPAVFGALLVLVFQVMVAVLSYQNRLSFVRVKAAFFRQFPLLILIMPSLLIVTASIVCTAIKSIDDAVMFTVEKPVLTEVDNAYLDLLAIEQESIETQQAFDNAVAGYRDSVNDEGVVGEIDSELKEKLGLLEGVKKSHLSAATKPGTQCPGFVNNHSPNAGLCSLNLIRS
jgi:hypothetical protein